MHDFKHKQTTGIYKTHSGKYRLQFYNVSGIIKYVTNQFIYYDLHPGHVFELPENARLNSKTQHLTQTGIDHCKNGTFCAH